MYTLSSNRIRDYKKFTGYGMDNIVAEGQFLKRAVKIFLIFACLYGTIAIYVDNLMIRSIKDFMLVFFFGYALLMLKRAELSNQLTAFIQFALISVCVIGACGFLGGNDLVTYIYGLKITILPIGMVFMGMIIYRYKIDFSNMAVLLYVMLVVVWLLQNMIGVQGLITQFGFEYGVNVRNYVDGTPRYPSLIGTPAGFSYVLAIVSIIIARSKIFFDRPKWLLLFNVITLGILILATIRSALFFWIISQAMIYLFEMRSSSARSRLFRYGLIFLSAPCLFLLLYYFISSTSLLDPSSFQARINFWTGSVPNLLAPHGLVGDGLGSVGAASRRTAVLGLDDSLNFSVDNQGLAIMIQIGLVGFVMFAAFYLSIYASIFKSFKNGSTQYSITALALMTGAFCAGFFVNVLESYPFVLFLWLFVGLALGERHSASRGKPGLSIKE